MPDLLLGPLLRHVGESDATVWVEADAACEVEVLGKSARTFHVAGHHYALVTVDGLEPGSFTEYQVALDGETVWPPADSEFPPSVIRTIGGGRPLEFLFGSCRMARPHRPPYTASPDESENGSSTRASTGSRGKSRPSAGSSPPSRPPCSSTTTTFTTTGTSRARGSSG